MSMLLRLARAVAALLNARRADVRGPAADDLLERAAEADGRGDHRTAERLCRQAIAAAPRAPDGWMNLGLALQLQGRLDDALEALRRAVELAPRSAPALYNLGRACH